MREAYDPRRHAPQIVVGDVQRGLRAVGQLEPQPPQVAGARTEGACGGAGERAREASEHGVGDQVGIHAGDRS
jgi:hypothetical protein